MNKAVVVAIALLTGFAGFLIGKSERGPRGRAQTRQDLAAAPRVRRVTLEPETYAELQRSAARAEALAEDNGRLREALRELAPEDPGESGGGALAPGARRPDGTIVGGAAWTKLTKTMALGFLDTKVAQFLKDANLTEPQRQRLQQELENRIGEVMQNTADFVNGDISADQAYASLEAVAAESRKMLATVLDERQLEVYGRFEAGMTRFVHSNVVNNEMATLRKELRLDPDQEKRIREIVEERYRRVQERLKAPIPNLFFRPLRRDRDRDIYEQTGLALAQHLRPEQAAAFALAEEKANEALYEYRRLLVPKSR